MPIVQIHLLEGRTIEQKRKLVASVTQAVCDSVNVTPDHVEVILSDMARHDYAAAGVLHIDNKKT